MARPLRIELPGVLNHYEQAGKELSKAIRIIKNATLVI